MAKINVRQSFKKRIMAIHQADPLRFPNLKESDFCEFELMPDLLQGEYEREDLNLAWLGFTAGIVAVADLDVAISVDMSAIHDENEDERRIYAKVEEWNSYTSELSSGGELTLVALYQSHNFDIASFKDPYMGKNKKFRPK